MECSPYQKETKRDQQKLDHRFSFLLSSAEYPGGGSPNIHDVIDRGNSMRLMRSNSIDGVTFAAANVTTL
jgi:hypothetical protein